VSHFDASGLGVFSSGNAITVSGEAVCAVNDLYGASSGGGGLRITASKARFVWGGSPPNLDAATNEVVIAPTNTFYSGTWAACAFRNNEQKGVATLVAGTAPVAARAADNQGVTISRNTPGGAVGDLSAPSASRTANQFVINSASGTDTSTVDWHIPPFANKITICDLGYLPLAPALA
jgi:hypothetical protein